MKKLVLAGAAAVGVAALQEFLTVRPEAGPGSASVGLRLKAMKKIWQHHPVVANVTLTGGLSFRRMENGLIMCCDSTPPPAPAPAPVVQYPPFPHYPSGDGPQWGSFTGDDLSAPGNTSMGW
jgi:hypothetical protein